MPNNRVLIIVAIVFAAIVGGMFYLVNTPCAEEDSMNCVWDGATMGNGTGDSFITLGTDNIFFQFTLAD